MVTEIMFRVSVLVSDELGYDLIFHTMPFTWIPIPSVFTHPFIPNPNQNLCGVKMEPLKLFDISGPELVESNLEAAMLFEKTGWGLFFKGFRGHHVEITRQFAMSLKDDVAQVGDFQLILNKDMIAKASKLPQIGEHWFKGQK